jgi:hypothetical protein
MRTIVARLRELAVPGGVMRSVEAWSAGSTRFGDCSRPAPSCLRPSP